MNSTKGTHELLKGKTRETSRGPERIGSQTVCRWSTLSLRHSDQQSGESTSSKLWSLDMRIQGSQNSPTSGVVNAKWRAKISTHVSINSNHKYALKIVSWAYTPENQWGINDEMHRNDKTSCTGSVVRFMRLKPRGDNQNKKILIYIPYASCPHRLSTHNSSCPQ